MRRSFVPLLVVLLLAWSLLVPAGAAAAPRQVAKDAVAEGTGGAAATVDAHATRTAIDVLDRGGNAVDAAVAAAAVLGVTQPYSCGIGGGGFMVVYLAEEQRVVTIDSRETAPAAFHEDVFVEDGVVIPFAERVTSGLGVGVPGTVAGWARALEDYGTMPLARVLQPAVTIAQRGWTVDDTFRAQTLANLQRFRQFTSTTETFLTADGEAPAVGSTVRNRDLAATLRLLQRHGPDAFYTGPLAAEIVATVTEPPLAPDATFNVRPGLMTTADLAAYTALERPPTHVSYRGLDVYGMGPPSSGGSTVGEALNILEGFPLGELDSTAALHRYLEALKLSFADRNAYLGDADFVDVPLAGLLSEAFAAERRALIDPDAAAAAPVPPGDPWPHDSGAGATAAAGAGTGGATTHLTVSDAAGNVVSYTFTIEQIGGSGITVPGRGFLLNNELTDFNPSGEGHPNLPEGGKRPRSSMSPTIVLDGGEPRVALGSPGGATIITTVLQILVNRVDLGMDLPEALAAPRASQLNGPNTIAEPAFVDAHGADLQALGHAFTTSAEIGAATAVEFLGDGRVQAVAEPVRRGAGSAAVQRPAR